MTEFYIYLTANGGEEVVVVGGNMYGFSLLDGEWLSKRDGEVVAKWAKKCNDGCYAPYRDNELPKLGKLLCLGSF